MCLAPLQGQMLTRGNESSRGRQAAQGQGHRAFQESWRSWASSSWSRDGHWGHIAACSSLMGSERRQSQSLAKLFGKRIGFCMNGRNYSSPWGWSSTESREAKHVLPQCYWKPSWERKALGTLTCLWLWPCLDQVLRQRPLESSYNLSYFIYIVLI